MAKKPRIRVKTSTKNERFKVTTKSHGAATTASSPEDEQWSQEIAPALTRHHELFTLLYNNTNNTSNGLSSGDVPSDEPDATVVTFEARVREAFARVFHPDMVLVDCSGEEFDYERLLQDYQSFITDKWRVRLVQIRPIDSDTTTIPHGDGHAPGVPSFHYVIRADRDDEEAVIRSRAYVGSDGLVFRVVRTTRAARTKIPGQSTATSTVQVPGLPTEEDLSGGLCQAPTEVRGKLLCEGIDLVPVRELYEVLHLCLWQEPSRMYRRQSVIPVRDVEGGPLCGGTCVVDIRRFVVAKRKEFVLRLDGVILAVCVRRPHNLHKNYTIYGRQPIVDADATIPDSTYTKESLTFYPWFRVRDSARTRLPYLPIYVWDGTDFVPFLRADTAERLQHPRMSPKSVLRSTTGAMMRTKSAGALVREVDGNASFGLVLPHSEGGCHVTVAPGVDPGMMLCLGLAIGDILRYIW